MMVDETKDLMVTLMGMTKGELVDVIDRLNDGLQASLNKAIDERDNALQEIEDLQHKRTNYLKTITQLLREKHELEKKLAGHHEERRDK